MRAPDKDIAGLARHPWSRAVIALAVLAALVVVALGGLRPAQSRQTLATISAGQAASNGAYRLTPQCAWVAALMPGRDYPEPGLRYLVLRLRVVNQMESARPGLEQDVVWLPQGKGAERKPDLLLRADDHSLYVQLQPRLPATVDLVWKLSERTPILQPPSWGVIKREYVPKGYLSGEGGWLQGDPAFKMQLPAGASCTAGAR